MKYLLKGLLLLTVAILFIPVGVLGLVYGIGEAFWKRTLAKAYLKIGKLFNFTALILDILLGVMASELLNDLLVKENGYKIGKHNETVSSALGKNQLKGTLTRAGRILVKILDMLDKNHCINAITKNVK